MVRIRFPPPVSQFLEDFEPVAIVQTLTPPGAHSYALLPIGYPIGLVS